MSCFQSFYLCLISLTFLLPAIPPAPVGLYPEDAVEGVGEYLRRHASSLTPQMEIPEPDTAELPII